MGETNVIKVPGGTIIGLTEMPPEVVPPAPEEEKPAPKKRGKKSANTDDK